MGAALSSANFVLFMTQDAIPADKKLIENLLAPMANPNIAVSYGRQLASKDSDIIEKMTRVYNYPKKSFIKSSSDLDRLGIKTYFCSNVCALYKKVYITSLEGL